MKKRGDELGTSCLVQLVVIIILMPIFGLILSCSEEPENKIAGTILFIVGLIIWVLFFGSR